MQTGEKWRRRESNPRTVEDAAAILSAIASRTADPRDPATNTSPTGIPRPSIPADYTAFLDSNGLRGARIGVPRTGVTDGITEEVAAAFEAALDVIRGAGATVVDPADIPTIADINSGFDEIVVLIFEFKDDLNAYLATRTGVPVHTMADVITFNNAHADVELKWFGQEWFELAEARSFFGAFTIDTATYLASAANERKIGGPDGIDAALGANSLDALVAPTDSPAWTTDLVNGDHFIFGTSSPAAIAGYPIINVPMGDAFGLPVGISFMGTAFSEPKLIKLASGFEAAAKARIVPKFLPTLPTDVPARRGSSKAKGLPHRPRSAAVGHL